MDPSYLEAVLTQLVAAFPEHTVTLVLRHPTNPAWNAVATTDQEPVLPSAMLGQYVLNNFQPEARH